MANIEKIQSEVLQEIFALRKIGNFVENRARDEFKRRLDKIEKLVK